MILRQPLMAFFFRHYADIFISIRRQTDAFDMMIIFAFISAILMLAGWPLPAMMPPLADG
jgi:hypothetical protein